MRRRFLMRWLIYGGIFSCVHFVSTLYVCITLAWSGRLALLFLFPFGEHFFRLWIAFAEKFIEDIPGTPGRLLMAAGVASAHFANSALVCFPIIALVLVLKSRKQRRAE